ncbi:BrxA/BrxB family bacilliredoxin [Croceimicrobium hydrocarbonivorans]|uniref:BrxA/BrxB family bacilliredoxin n=1 Tax=Croceimicrobium hydrocarbonivorans TaxID=2761580 RepID=A0A7H0VA80_9FLAO|nr:BrxA/BrxB family bacilliredoxin [Croceimicrobium hydrocarbonivorans]QNR22628.1 BrxA/BrxB family bacilliredoxin [Croceimicrobium hydrocarbonivorans]|tara:strand:+ start:1347 stop:1757 length:411 start_codon:yes stop_codon:yes gene_type:complete
MYPEDIIAPMRADLTDAGITETRSKEEVEQNIKSEGTTLVVINSVCGCAAANARPAVKMAAQHAKTPDRMITAFAGNDVDAVNTARALMAPFPPSSPSIALFKDGKLVHMIERHHIEGRQAEVIAQNLTAAFDEYC